MTEIAANNVVSLQEGEENTWIICHDVPVGFIKLEKKEDRAEVTFRIEEPYRSNHYASNGLYLFDAYAHEHLDVNVLHAVIPAGNDPAKHVVEHSGYHIVSRDAQKIYYAHEQAATRRDDDLQLTEGQEVLYLAGGCFWGMERVFRMLDGVVSTCTGYANGSLANPSYEDVIRNETGYKETVRVIYDSSAVSLETVLTAYFLCIDPTDKDGQGGDTGVQYHTGVYYRDPSQKERLEQFFTEEKKKYSEFWTDLRPLQCFYEAEEYHQDYLTKNPNGYCHITLVDLNKVKELNRKQ